MPFNDLWTQLKRQSVERALSEPAKSQSPRPQKRQFDEQEFRKWYGTQAGRFQLDPDPDNPLHLYDYRAAYREGYGPDPSDGHWPSQFKHPNHPNRFVDGIDTITGRPMVNDWLNPGGNLLPQQRERIRVELMRKNAAGPPATTPTPKRSPLQGIGQIKGALDRIKGR